MADEHLCPQHVGGPLIEGDPSVTINGAPLARVSDRASCKGPSDPIVTGAATVVVHGKPASRLGEVTSHAGTISSGAPNVLIGGPSTTASIDTQLGHLIIIPHARAADLSGNQVTLDEYLRIRRESLLPNHDWGVLDFIKWQLGEKITKYKDAWVRDHATSIKIAARMNGLPPELVAGTAWAEVGGDPVIIDDIAHDVRSFDHSADPLLESLTITDKPNLVSAGDVSIQIRRVAETLGLDPARLSYRDRRAILNLLKNDQWNLAIVARHLRELADIDFKGKAIGTDQMRIVGARYNRGPHLPLGDIMNDTSYGDDIVGKLDRLQALLSQGVSGGLPGSLITLEMLAAQLGGYPATRGA